MRLIHQNCPTDIPMIYERTANTAITLVHACSRPRNVKYKHGENMSLSSIINHLETKECYPPRSNGEKGIKIADKLYIGKKRCKIFSISNTSIQQYTRSVNERVNAIESLFLIAKSNNTTEFAQVIGEYARLRDFRCKDERIV